MNRGPESGIVSEAAPRADGASARMAEALAGRQANDRPAVGIRSHGTSGGGGGVQPDGITVPGGGVPVGHGVGPMGLGARVLQVPAAAFRWTRIPGNVLVRNSPPEYELVLAAKPPTGASQSAATATAGSAPVSIVSARSTPTASPPTPVSAREPATPGSMRRIGTRSSISVKGAIPSESLGSVRNRREPPSYSSNRTGSTSSSSVPRGTGDASPMRPGRPPSRP